MQTKILPASDPSAIEEAARILREGGVVAFPTETVYGLGANGLSAESCRKIYKAKGRPSDNPLILHLSNLSMIGRVVREVPLKAQDLLRKFTPGPLTVILPRNRDVPDAVTGGLSTVGIRIPSHEIARKMIAAANVPIAAPSANIAGRPSPTTAEAVKRDLDGRIPLILDAGPCQWGVESTIVDATGEIPVILRPGAITREEIEALIGPVQVSPTFPRDAADKAVPRAPGMKYRHYAPKAPLTVLEAPADVWFEEVTKFLRETRGQGKDVALIASEETLHALDVDLPSSRVYSLGSRENLEAIAAELYRALRFFDDDIPEEIFIESFPEGGIGLALMNRIRKASGGRSLQFNDGIWEEVVL